ncbi:hypothetical protein PDE_04072 [Penicillium oxalicum 114-2]|uniref:Uncharacterized protein n=1 Tax=Penicillium oxalicum (strain 114-2 / CGMCC 5302) TaxID=933388 RepID=S8ASQ4_PENO1|nr:hypothetical protein PDE_04072 [Penicillium oxalicum 114-2]
MRLTVSNVPD